jgi:ligand-binding SRPBCC domain-containing protein
MSKVYHIKTVQKIPVGINEAWAFFSSPLNLKDITPTDLDFKVKTPPFGGTIYPGQVIEYTIKPVFGIPLYWMTEITSVKDKAYFVDEQRFGPYSLWHHQHHFAIIDGGVEMVDIVHYKIPFWFLGDIANTVFVLKQLEGIFAYRFKAVEEKFGKWASQVPDVTFF